MITLAAIIGNEEAVIERFLRSFAPAVDSFVLVRSIGVSSPDESFRIAERVCAELHKPLALEYYANKHPLPHVDDFSAARNLAFEIAMCEAENESEYLLWADADDTITTDAAAALREAAAAGTHDIFLCPYHVRSDKQVVVRERMVRADTLPRWKYELHEQIEFGREVTYRILQDAIITHSPAITKTGSNERNLAILNRCVADAGRCFFYIAQQHFQTGQERAFVKAATVALACPDTGELERYELLLQLAQTPLQDSRKLAAEAYAIMPDRREALALLANYCLIDGDYEKALLLCEKLLATPHPLKTYWSQNNEWYGWKAQSLYCQCLRLAGRQQPSPTDGPPVFSIIHGTLNRPEKALAIREMWLSAARHPERVEYIFGLHSGDAKSNAMLRGFPHTIIESNGPDWLGSAANFDTAAGISAGKVIIAAQDDCYPPHHWDDRLTEIIGDLDKPAYVAVSDGHRTDRLNVSSIMTRAYMETKAARDPGESGFCHRGYPSAFPDTENSVRAIQDGAAGVCEYIDAPDFVLYHDHPLFNPAMPWDETYIFESDPELFKASAEIFSRRNPGLPLDILERSVE